MTSPSDHVALLELLGWMELIENESVARHGLWGKHPGFKTLRFVTPPLDDNLLRTAREQLLTTEELRDEFLKRLQRVVKSYNMYHPMTRMWLILSASAAEQAAVLVGMRDSGQFGPRQNVL